MRRRQPRGVNRFHINLSDSQAKKLVWLSDRTGLSFSVVIGQLVDLAYRSATNTDEPPIDD